MIRAITVSIGAGFLGRALRPGKDKMGFFATIALGLAGALIGYLVFTEPQPPRTGRGTDHLIGLGRRALEEALLQMPVEPSGDRRVAQRRCMSMRAWALNSQDAAGVWRSA